MGWGVVDTQTITMPNASTSASGTFITLMPGESAQVELLRIDVIAPSEPWQYSVPMSADGVTEGDTAPRRVLGLTFVHPIFGIRGSDGIQHFNVRIFNPNLGPNDIVKVTMNVYKDGVAL